MSLAPVVIGPSSFEILEELGKEEAMIDGVDWEEYKKYYDMVRTEDPDNVEAKFFYSYYRMFSDTQGHAYN